MKRGVLAMAVALSACAAQQPATRGDAPPEPKRTKLVVLPVDSHDFPRLAGAINTRLRTVKPSGIDDCLFSKVTLEVVQLSIECVAAINDCWSAMGRSLPADRLLLGHIARAAKRRSLTLTVTYFDVAEGKPIHVGERQFKNEDEALRDLGEVVAEALGERPVEKTAARSRPGQ